MVMPQMTGRELASKLREGEPELPLILISGYDPDGTEDNSRGYSFIQKPVVSSRLLKAIQLLLGQDSG